MKTDLYFLKSINKESFDLKKYISVKDYQSFCNNY